MLQHLITQWNAIMLPHLITQLHSYLPNGPLQRENLTILALKEVPNNIDLTWKLYYKYFGKLVT